MRNAETKSRAGSAQPAQTPAHEVKAAMAGFLSDFKDFQTDIKTKLIEQDTRLTMLDRKSLAANRPALSHAADLEQPHAKAIGAYLRSGDDDGLRGLELDGKALNTAVAAEGGYLVDPQTTHRILSVLEGASSLRAVANVVQVDSVAFDVLIDQSNTGYGWASETGAFVETDTPTIERITIPLHELSALPKASQRLLDDSAFDVEGWLAERIGDRFVREESKAFISGTGVNQPTGFLTYTAVENDSWTWGNLGYVATGEAGDFSSAEPADAIVDLVYSLGARYRAKAQFIMNSKTAGAVRKMKDADGRFLWSDGLAAAEPARLMGYPVLIAEEMPEIADGETAIAFGDFNSGYTIAEKPDMRILRDPFSAKPHVLFYATKRVGGDVSDFAAIKLLKFSLS